MSWQGSAKTKEEAEKALQDTNKLDKDVDDMMDQLSAAEEELKKKKAEADSDMMMASMVRTNALIYEEVLNCLKRALLIVGGIDLSCRRRIPPSRPRTTLARPRVR